MLAPVDVTEFQVREKWTKILCG